MLQVSHRGSYGWGQAFPRAICADWGYEEVLDVLTALDSAVQQGIASPAWLGSGR